VESLNFSFVDFKDFELLAEFPLLKEITILNDSSKIPSQWPEFRLSDFLKTCSNTLESITIAEYSVQFDLDDTQQYSIKEMDIFRCTLPKGFDHFISKSLPHVHSLFFSRVMLSKRKFFMPNIHLSLFSLSKCEVHDELVYTANDNEQRWWSTKPNKSLLLDFYGGNDSNWLPPITAKPFSQVDGFPSMTLVCGSVKCVHISDLP
jgi:hypothetical protein